MKQLLLFTAALCIITCSYGQVIQGTVLHGDSAMAKGTVKLMSAGNEGSMMKIMLSTTPDSAGHYAFTDLPNGSYLVQFAPDESWLMKTYNGDAHRWDAAPLVAINNDTSTQNIDVLKTYEWWWGNGSCGGTGTYFSIGKTSGEPIPGIDVSLEQIPGGAIKIQAATDDNGFYSVESMPFDVTYDVHIEVPGLVYDSTYRITLTAENPEQMSLDFVVDTTSGAGKIFILHSVTSTVELGQPDHWIKSYPNPAQHVVNFETGWKVEPNTKIHVYNTIGELIHQTIFTDQSASISTDSWANGSYIYQLTNNQNVVTMGRFNLAK